MAVWAGAGSRWPCWGWVVRGWRGRVFRVDGGVGRRRVRAGASVDATRGDATSVCVYICAGLRLPGGVLVTVFFSAFWLRSSVVSVLISLISGIQAIGL